MSSRLKLEALKQTREYKRNVHILAPIVECLEQLLPPDQPSPVPVAAFQVSQEVAAPATLAQQEPPPLASFGERARAAEARSKKRISRKDGMAEARARSKSIASDPVTPSPGRVSSMSPGTVEALREAAAQDPQPKQFRINLYV